MLRSLLLVLALAQAPLSAPAMADGRSQLLASVSRDLPFFVPGVDATTLTTSQLAAINGVINRDLSHSHKIAGIKSVLGGQTFLRDILSK